MRCWNTPLDGTLSLPGFTHIPYSMICKQAMHELLEHPFGWLLVSAGSLLTNKREIETLGRAGQVCMRMFVCACLCVCECVSGNVVCECVSGNVVCVCVCVCVCASMYACLRTYTSKLHTECTTSLNLSCDFFVRLHKHTLKPVSKVCLALRGVCCKAVQPKSYYCLKYCARAHRAQPKVDSSYYCL